MINKEKNWQTEINKKLLNQVRTEEKNRSIGKVSYCIFVFLFSILKVACQSHFYFVTLIDLLLGQDIINPAIGSIILTEKEVIFGLLGLFLWKMPISFRKYYTTNAGS